MKVQKVVKVFALLASAMLVLPTGAFAARSVSGAVNGLTTYGSVALGSDFASADTSASGQAMLTVNLTYVYKWGPTIDSYTVNANDSGFKTGVRAQANAGHVHPESVDAYAFHSVASGSGYWSGNTSIK